MAATLGTGDGAAQSVFLDTNAHLDVDDQTLSVGTNAPGCSVFGGSCSRFAGIVRVASEGTLVLAGDATWSNGGWLVDGTVENRGTLRITGNTRANASGNGLGLVRNLPGATITRATSAGQADIAVPLDIDGQVNVDTGTLLLQGGSGAATSSGRFTLARAGTLGSFGGHRLSPGGRVTGPARCDSTAACSSSPAASARAAPTRPPPRSPRAACSTSAAAAAPAAG